MPSPAFECDREDARWCVDHLSAFPDGMRGHIEAHYGAVFREQGRRPANLFLLDLGETIGPQTCRLAGSDEELCRHAAHRAFDAAVIANRATSLADCYARLSRLVQAHGLTPPVNHRGITLQGAVNRMKNDVWWRHGIRRAHARNVEHLAIRIGSVHKGAQLYVSDDNLNRRRQQKARNRALLETLDAISDEGETQKLIDLVDHSNANPRIRRAEFMTRIAGFEQLANGLNYHSVFLTITCPARFHAVLSATGKRNPKYDGSTPRDAQQWLIQYWNRTRSGWNRHGIRPFGFRIAEPHHDGAPHWHLILFVAPSQYDGMLAIIRHNYFQDSGSEPGAAEHRLKIIEIDRTKGTATGYVAKYISKNISDDPCCPDDARSASERVEAWAATWGIRQFQQVGGPSVTLWRELRRLNPAKLPGDLRLAAEAADSGDWATFVKQCGGPHIARKDCPFKLMKYKTATPGRYGDYSTHRISAIRWNNVTVLTRFKNWKIQRRINSERGPPSFLTLESCQ